MLDHTRKPRTASDFCHADGVGSPALAGGEDDGYVTQLLTALARKP